MWHHISLLIRNVGSWTSFLTPTLVELEFPFTGEEVDYFFAAAAAGSSITPYPDEGSPLFAYMNATGDIFIPSADLLKLNDI
jgi:hypothetical protein